MYPTYHQAANRFTCLLGGKYSDDPLLEIILGYTFQVPKSVIEYRKNKLAKIKQIDAP